MSGGVDSSAAAALLSEQGYEVIGMTLKLWPQGCGTKGDRTCCGPEAVADERSVCQSLDVPYYFLDEEPIFRKKVVAYFAEEYKAGRTPNPCVMCNEHVKFASLLKRADLLEADFIATGHFARVEHNTSGRTLLKRGKDLRKDQSYYLFTLKQEQLKRVLFPLGEMTKAESRGVARDHELQNADKKDSMEICFVPDNDYGKFLRDAELVKPHRGDIVDTHGRKLGEHDGIEFYTIGQRRGLRVAHATPLYVVDLDPKKNRVIVGGDHLLEQHVMLVERCNWISIDHPSEPFEATVKIRYNHPGSPALVHPTNDGRARVEFKDPQRAITPGQATVFYQADVVVGGGWIRKS
jgi:tRNA-specific 2-thiouridylase